MENDKVIEQITEMMIKRKTQKEMYNMNTWISEEVNQRNSTKSIPRYDK